MVNDDFSAQDGGVETNHILGDQLTATGSGIERDAGTVRISIRHFGLFELSSHKFSMSQKPTNLPYIPTGTYQIVNQHTGAYAGLLNNDDRSAVVGLTLGLEGHEERGATVCRCLFHSFDNLSTCHATVDHHSPPGRRVHASEHRLRVLCQLRPQSQD